MAIKRSPVSLQKEIKEEYRKQEEIFKNNSFMGKVTGINIEAQSRAATLQILTEKGCLNTWTVSYNKYELNQLERYLFNEIPLFKNGAVVEEMEIITKPYY